MFTCPLKQPYKLTVNKKNRQQSWQNKIQFSFFIGFMWSRLWKYQSSQWFYRFSLKTFPVFSSFYADGNISECNHCPENSSSRGQTFVTVEVNNRELLLGNFGSLYLCVIRPTYHSNIVSDKINALRGNAPRCRQTPAEWWALPNHRNYCSQQQRNMIKKKKHSPSEPKQTQPIKLRNDWNQRTNINPQQPSSPPPPPTRHVFISI